MIALAGLLSAYGCSAPEIPLCLLGTVPKSVVNGQMVMAGA